MPDIDVSVALDSPMLQDGVVVTRRLETVSSKGRSVVAPQVFRNVGAVVNAASGNDLERLEEGDRMGNNITVVTRFPLRGPSKSGTAVYKPDVVTWQGDDYVVKAVDSYPQYGRGFVQAVCGAVDMLQQADA